MADSIFDDDSACCGVSAVLLGETGAPDLDGTEWEFSISSEDVDGTVRLVLAGSNDRGREIEGGELESAVESLAGAFAAEDRIGEMLTEHASRGPFELRDEGGRLVAHRHRPRP